MYAYIKGIVAEKTASSVVVDVGGVGYELFVTTSLAASCEIGSERKFSTYLSVKEDEMSLYGFSSQNEKSLFLQLLDISGVGPKLALAILGGLPFSELAGAIAAGNTAVICSIKGVGKKTAERIVMELKDKIEVPAGTSVAPAPAKKTKLDEKAKEAVSVLIALGIKPDVAERNVLNVYDGSMTVNQIVHKAIGG